VTSPLIDAPDTTLAAGLEERVSHLWWLISREAPTAMSRSAAATLARLREDGPQRISALAHGESVSQPSMTSLVQRLERDAYVTRRPDPADARAAIIAITAAGRRALEARAGLRTDALAARLRRLGARQRAQLEAALPALDALLAEAA
jgi:DNA-binding MarR family transcriptional regulator